MKDELVREMTKTMAVIVVGAALLVCLYILIGLSMMFWADTHGTRMFKWDNTDGRGCARGLFVKELDDATVCRIGVDHAFPLHQRQPLVREVVGGSCNDSVELAHGTATRTPALYSFTGPQLQLNVSSDIPLACETMQARVRECARAFDKDRTVFECRPEWW